MLINKLYFKRISAYIADFLLVSFIIALFSDLYIINPYYDKYVDLSNEYVEYMELVVLNETEANFDKINKYTYDLSYYSVYISIITVVVYVLYFVIFQYLNNGKTIGKAIYKLKVQSYSGKKASFLQLLIRYLILVGILTSIISIVSIFILPMSKCLNVLSVVQSIDNILIISCLLMIIFKKDNRGLHDLLGNTCVIEDNI